MPIGVFQRDPSGFSHHPPQSYKLPGELAVYCQRSFIPLPLKSFRLLLLPRKNVYSPPGRHSSPHPSLASESSSGNERAFTKARRNSRYSAICLFVFPCRPLHLGTQVGKMGLEFHVGRFRQLSSLRSQSLDVRPLGSTLCASAPARPKR